MTAITREEAEEIIELQLGNEDSDYDVEGNTCWHYGRCELAILLDNIYGVEDD